MNDFPHSLITLHGASDEKLQEMIRTAIERWPHWQGYPICAVGGGMTEIIPLPGERIEPDIEDEP